MSHTIIIYGAYGYTGTLITKRATERGLRPLLAGRDEAKTKKLADELGLNWVSFTLEDAGQTDVHLEGAGILLNCAGPFSRTALPLMEACIRKKVHYLDITGEIQVFELAHKLGKSAKEAGIVLLPGVGFDIVPSDCLAAYVASKLPDAQSLELSFTGGAGFSRGTALTMAENIYLGGAIRKDGKIIQVPHGFETKYVRFQEKDRLCVTIPWGDVSTAFYSTGIPNIKVFIAQPSPVVRMLQTVQAFKGILGWRPFQHLIKRYIKKVVKGPTEEERETGFSFLHALATNERGQKYEARLLTPEGYKLTAHTSVMSVEKLLAKGEHLAGFKTPSMAFGYDFIWQIEGVKLHD